MREQLRRCGTALAAGFLLYSTAGFAEITYSGEARRPGGQLSTPRHDSPGTDSGGWSGRQRPDGAGSDRHLRYPLQTTPDYSRERSREDSRYGFQHGYRHGYRDGYRDNDRYYGDQRPGYGHYGYELPRPGYGYGSSASPYGGSDYGYRSNPYPRRGTGYSPTYRYPSVPQPLSPYRR